MTFLVTETSMRSNTKRLRSRSMTTRNLMSSTVLTLPTSSTNTTTGSALTEMSGSLLSCGEIAFTAETATSNHEDRPIPEQFYSFC